MGYFWKCPKCGSTDLKPSRLTPKSHRCRGCNMIVRAKLFYRDENGIETQKKNRGTINRLLGIRRRPLHKGVYREDVFISV